MRLNGDGGLVGGGIGVDPHVGEVRVQPGFQVGAYRLGERLPGRAQDIMNRGALDVFRSRWGNVAGAIATILKTLQHRRYRGVADRALQRQHRLRTGRVGRTRR